MKSITKYWFLEGFSLFQKITKLNMMEIIDILEMDNIETGKLVDLNRKYKNSVFFLKKGAVKIVDSKTDTLKYVVKSGNIFGEMIFYDQKAANEEVAYTLEDCIICHIKAENMLRFMEKNKSIKAGLLKIYGIRIQKLELRLYDLLNKSSTTRIREFISDYLEEFGEANAEGRIIAKNLLSHKDIANLTNTSRQTVSNVLSTMRKEREIDYNVQFISKN